MSCINIENIQSKLKELEETNDKFWNIPPETGNLLNIIIKASNYKKVLEIGTSNGYSAIWLTRALKETGGHLVSLEFWQKRIDLAKPNLKYCGLLDYATIRCGSALKLIHELTPQDFKDQAESLSIDLVFIDANKREYIQYFNLVDKLVKVGGMIIADNIDSHREKVSDFLDEIYNNNSYQVQELPFRGGLLVGLKIK